MYVCMSKLLGIFIMHCKGVHWPVAGHHNARRCIVCVVRQQAEDLPLLPPREQVLEGHVRDVAHLERVDPLLALTEFPAAKTMKFLPKIVTCLIPGIMTFE